MFLTAIVAMASLFPSTRPPLVRRVTSSTIYQTRKAVAGVNPYKLLASHDVPRDPRSVPAHHIPTMTDLRRVRRCLGALILLAPVPTAAQRSLCDETPAGVLAPRDRKSTRLNSSHRCISYAVFCL